MAAFLPVGMGLSVSTALSATLMPRTAPRRPVPARQLYAAERTRLAHTTEWFLSEPNADVSVIFGKLRETPRDLICRLHIRLLALVPPSRPVPQTLASPRRPTPPG